MTWNELTERSYVPYSENKKACIVIGSSGTCYPGVRIENASFPLSITEDLAAICYCLSEGDTPEVIYNQKDDSANYSFWKEEFSVDIQPLANISDLTFKNPLLTEVPEPIPSALHNMLDRAICPHSNFRVSTLLKCDEGWISGVNVEFSEWQRGLCAERLALAKAISSGITTFQEIHLHTSRGGFISPCGACRQVILEHMAHHRVTLHHPNKSLSVHYTSDLLPFNFSPDSLK